MSNTKPNNPPLHSYYVWDRPVRIFHWLNVICVIGLIGIGLIILNNKSFGVSPDGKVLLKTLHVYLGYAFVINLSIRLIWLFFGNQYAKWKAILPVGKKYRESLQAYIKALKAGKPPEYAGHNPLARLMVAALFLLLTTQAITGLVLAGTDIYFPPFGHEIAQWVTGGDPDKLANLNPGSKEHVDPKAYKAMREFRKPFITLHYYSFYLLLIAIFFHIAGVVISEIRERCGLVSAMFTGDKVFSKKPLDYDN